MHEYNNINGCMVYLECIINQSIRINPNYDGIIGMNYVSISDIPSKHQITKKKGSKL